jgi:hypothetical protein
MFPQYGLKQPAAVVINWTTFTNLFGQREISKNAEGNQGVTKFRNMFQRNIVITSQNFVTLTKFH